MADSSPGGSDKPVGTLKELEEAGLDPRFYASCSEPIQRLGKNLGCAYHSFCVFADARDRTGPINVPIRIIKSNGRIRQVVMACYEYMAGPYMLNEVSGGSVAQVIGKEGDTVKTMGTTQVPAASPQELPKHRSAIFETKVLKHPHVGDNEDLAQEAFAAQIRKEIIDDAKAKKLAKNLRMAHLKLDEDEADTKGTRSKS